ncbi:hypothetical protein SKAU_G00421010 [Synaphobranchus kaupii]|uniref:Saposin B-type domain-containing protein n=1 Tax=Synaphobranchus kaupii TaxID=118154 RepID=A0A9Q1E6U4_SYNKA|nr:hypothetical protein SKAU_G00421010 [Synaphobranchus kaupii]
MKFAIILCFLLAYTAFAQSGHFHGNGVLETDDDMALKAEAEAETTENIPVLCSICKRIMKKVKARLSDHPSKEEIKEKLQKVCKKIRPFKRKCKKLVKKYLTKLVYELLTSDSARTACVKIKLCKRKALWE